MRLTCTFLSEQEKQLIHEDRLAIHSTIGVKFMSARALKTAPQSFVLGAVVWPNVVLDDIPRRADRDLVSD
ncbi:MAG: hypothetical protein KKE37_02715 [Verrucomicrobia bacterium]|nr:hypothetical protein [Verrucomicrobiota bacterium]MBU4428248.1 hypothetical protein [Verrucomicrobiota bacterium]MCG2679547.1 hypothetical protein [Kiritimatiellia bacterium]